MDDRDLRRKAELAELLLHAARQLGESLEPHVVYERFHELLAVVVPHDGIVISSYDDRDDVIRCEYAWSDGHVVDPAKLPPLPLNREGGGMQSRVIVSGGAGGLFNDVPARVERDGVFYNVDAEGKVERIPESGPAGTNAAMMVPVKDEGRVVGVVQLMRDRGVYTDVHREVFDGLVARWAPRSGTRVYSKSGGASSRPKPRRAPPRPSGSRRLRCSRPSATACYSSTARTSCSSGTEPPRSRPGWRGTASSASRSLDVIPDWPTLARRIPVAEEGAARSLRDATPRARWARPLAVVRSRPDRRRRRLRVPQRHERAPARRPEERLRGDDLA